MRVGPGGAAWLLALGVVCAACTGGSAGDASPSFARVTARPPDPGCTAPVGAQTVPVEMAVLETPSVAVRSGQVIAVSTPPGDDARRFSIPQLEPTDVLCELGGSDDGVRPLARFLAVGAGSARVSASLGSRGGTGNANISTLTLVIDVRP